MLHAANDKSKETKSLNDIHRPIFIVMIFITTSHVCVALYVWCHQISNPLPFEIKTMDL